MLFPLFKASLSILLLCPTKYDTSAICTLMTQPSLGCFSIDNASSKSFAVSGSIVKEVSFLKSFLFLISFLISISILFTSFNISCENSSLIPSLFNIEVISMPKLDLCPRSLTIEPVMFFCGSVQSSIFINTLWL